MIPSKSKTARLSPRGFSLIELMAVIIIIGVLGAIVTISMGGATERAKIAATKSSMATVKSALNIYRGTYNTFPDSTSAGLQVLVQDKYIEKLPKDGWNRDIEYYAPTQEYPNGFELLSAGPDLVSGTGDDIRMTPETP
jgi:general secretion pathway protein G